MGSELIDSVDDEMVWGTFWEGGSWDDRLSRVALPLAIDRPVSELSDSLMPGGQLLVVELGLPSGILRAHGYPGLFEGLVETLAEHGTHHKPEAIGIEELVEGRDPIIGFGYDWRRDLASEARRLHAVVVAASEERAARTGNPRIDIVGHSMGNLIVRWYLRYGAAPVPDDDSLPELTWAGVKYIERALLVASPNMGEARAVESLLIGDRENPMVPRYPAAIIATFPSAYELLPRPRDARVVYADTGEAVDVYDVAVWEALGWGAFGEDQDDELRILMPGVESRAERLAILRTHMAACLAHAQRFHRALDRPAAVPPELRVHVFVGDAHETPAVLRVDRESGAVEWGEPEPGDGTLTRTSALGQPRVNLEEPSVVSQTSVHFTDAEHLPIVADPDFLDQALYLLLEAPDPPKPATTAGVSARSSGIDATPTTTSEPGRPTKNLADLRWIKRVLLLPPEGVRALDWKRYARALEERDLILFREGPDGYVQVFPKPSETVSLRLPASIERRALGRVTLIGKDGGIKFQEPEERPNLPATVFNTIDAMPMRQREAAGRSGGQ